jgi:DNA polymerase (family 10)
MDAAMTNKELADHLRDLHVFLTIAGYDEMHARRYIHIASEVEDLEEPAEQLAREGRLKEIHGVGPSVAGYIKEILQTGKSSKQEEWEKVVPFGIVELVRVPGLGMKTAARLYKDFAIVSREDLKRAIDEGRLNEAQGIGEKTLERWTASLNR